MSSFAIGFLIGQLTLSLILFFFIKFFLFSDSPPSNTSNTSRPSRRLTSSLSPKKPTLLDPNNTNVLSADQILSKTIYPFPSHPPESLDWFNVLIAQTIAQLRFDARNDNALIDSLTGVLNSTKRPEWLDEIRVVECNLGEGFPILGNCRIIPVDEHGDAILVDGGKDTKKAKLRDATLQARMDVDLADVMTLGIETRLVLNHPRPKTACLPVGLSVSVVRFSGTLSVSFIPSEAPSTSSVEEEGKDGAGGMTLAFTFLDDYRLELSVHSLIGSRSRLQDVPKVAQIVKQRIHQWFDERCVEPRFQQIVLPSLWPRKKNVRVGGAEDAHISDDNIQQVNEDANHNVTEETRQRKNANSTERDELEEAGKDIKRAEERFKSLHQW